MATTSTYGITARTNAPLFTGTDAPLAEVPGRFEVALAGRGFLLDLASGQYRAESIPLLRQQSDQSDQPGEASVNPEDMWRRMASTWHKGAGQRDFDGPTSDPARYYTSKGVDPWTLGEIAMLPDTDRKSTSANTNLALAVAGGYLYTIDGASVKYTQDVTVDAPTWTDITGEPGVSPTSITSNGYTVYTAHGSSGIYQTTRGSGSTASYVTGTVAGVRYVKGRLFAWSTDKLYNVTATGALPTALLDHANSDFVWVDVAEAAGYYFPAGYSGDKSTIYKTAVRADGAGLGVPTVAAELPDGEIILAVHGYLGWLLIGTNLGVRFGIPDGEGNVELGALIDDALNVRCFEGQDRFVWFGWSAYDASSGGLGRMDLSVFNGTKPAYASDLMVASTNNVLSVATFQGIRVFTVSGYGIVGEHTNKVASGTIELGRITYGLYDQKVSMHANLSHVALAGTLSVAIAKDGAAYTTLAGEGITAGAVTSAFPTGKARAEAFDTKITMTRSATDATAGPRVTRFTLRSYPVAARSERVTVPLLLNKDQYVRVGAATTRDPADDLRFLRALESDGTPFMFQEARDAYEVVLEDHVWVPHQLDQKGNAFSGTYYAKLRRFAGE